MKKRFGLVVVATLSSLLATAMLAAPAGYGFGYNYTPSLPQGIYAWQPIKNIERGQLVLACMPPSPLADLAKARNYFRGATSSDCQSSLPPLLKRVVGVPGDSVLIDKYGVAINGEHIETSEPRQRDSAGREMPAPQSTAKILKPGEFVLIAPHELSLDSRYFGAVTRAELLSSAKPAFTF